MTLGQRIQEHRLRLELSQEALGEKLGVSRQAVSKWEADGAVPDTDKLIALSKLFGLTLNELLQVEGPEGTSASEPEPERGPAERQASAGPDRTPLKNGVKWLMGGLTALCLALGAGLIWTGVRLTALEERVAQQAVVQDTLDPADLVADCELEVGSAVYTNSSIDSVRLYRDVTVTVSLSRYDPAEEWTVFFQAYGSGAEPRQVDGQAVDGARGVYSAQVPVAPGLGETIAVGIQIEGVEYLQPLARIISVSDNSIFYDPLLPPAAES